MDDSAIFKKKKKKSRTKSFDGDFRNIRTKSFDGDCRNIRKKKEIKGQGFMLRNSGKKNSRPFDGVVPSSVTPSLASKEASASATATASATASATATPNKYSSNKNSIRASRHDIMNQGSSSTTRSKNAQRTKRIASSIGGVGIRPDIMISCFIASLKEGLQHGLSLSYFVDVPGNIYFLIYLLIIRDLSWSQYIFDVGWIYVGAIASAASVFWSVGLLLGAVRFHFYDMAWMSSALVLWTLADFIWMNADFYSVYSSTDPDTNMATIGQIIAQYLLFCATLLMTVFYTILIPFGVFNTNNHLYLLPNKITKKRLDETNPFCPRFWIQKYAGNRDFLQYSGMHLFLWITKDLMWSFGLFTPYIILFVASYIFLIDLSLREITQTLQYTNIINTIFMKLWITATGIWVIGDFKTNTDDKMILQLQEFARGVLSGDGDMHQTRRVAGWVYLSTILLLLLFYLHWGSRSRSKKSSTPNLQPYDDYKKQFNENQSLAEKLGAEVNAERKSLVASSKFLLNNNELSTMTTIDDDNNKSAFLVPDEENNLTNSGRHFITKKKVNDQKSTIKDTTVPETNDKITTNATTTSQSATAPKVENGTVEDEPAAAPAKITLFFPGMTKHDSDKHMEVHVVRTTTDSDKKTHDVIASPSTRNLNSDDAVPVWEKNMETMEEDTETSKPEPATSREEDTETSKPEPATSKTTESITTDVDKAKLEYDNRKKLETVGASTHHFVRKRRKSTDGM